MGGKKYYREKIRGANEYLHRKFLGVASNAPCVGCSEERERMKKLGRITDPQNMREDLYAYWAVYMAAQRVLQLWGDAGPAALWQMQPGNRPTKLRHIDANLGPYRPHFESGWHEEDVARALLRKDGNSLGDLAKVDYFIKLRGCDRKQVVQRWDSELEDGSYISRLRRGLSLAPKHE